MRLVDVRQEPALPWRRDQGELAARLSAWARSHRGAGAAVEGVRAPDSGMANDTVLFRLDGEPLVARLAPAPDSLYPTFPTYDLELQQRVLELVRSRTAVPVPEVVHLERSDEWLGVPFLVTRAVDGAVASDNPPYLMDPNGWFLRATPEQRRRVEAASIDVLVQLHRVADEGDATAFLRPRTPGVTALERQLSYQRGYYEWACADRPVPALERAFDVLAVTMPANDRSVLNWGDSRPGNVMYRDFEPVAVLDWEMATVGPPEVDLAWMTFFHSFFQGMAEQYGLPGVPDLFQRKDAVAIYERLSGDTLD
ncbi:MAG TPA: phosphotransferase family protein, partial [Acidimicrobiia bacterium]|nr:phosphotransferase family protein [Acidimicrobiia bacterium]